MKLDRELRKEWIKHYTAEHHSRKPKRYGQYCGWFRQSFAANNRRDMRQRRADRKTQQQQRRNTR